MDKKQIIDAILEKQNSISDTSSCSSGYDTELKKEGTFTVYQSENIENTETEEDNRNTNRRRKRKRINKRRRRNNKKPTK